jgi:hypothetical protein
MALADAVVIKVTRRRAKSILMVIDDGDAGLECQKAQL